MVRNSRGACLSYLASATVGGEAMVVGYSTREEDVAVPSLYNKHNPYEVS